MTVPRQALFLQGLPGDFFARLGEALAAQGVGVHRVNFNGGDAWDWPASGALNFRGSLRTWPAYLTRLIRERAITDVILFGDCRPLHRTARSAAAGLGVAVHVFEEGYIRPDWVTLERGGVNGFSPLPPDPAWWRRAGAHLPPTPVQPPLRSARPRRARCAITHHTAALLASWSYPHYRTHRPWPPMIEAIGWLGRLAGRHGAARRSRAALARLAAGPYFVLPLQLDSDYQLRTHSDYGGMLPALAQILASFAANAPRLAMLVVKLHPLDNGLTDWRKQTYDCARALGLIDRVIFLEDADIDALVRGAVGLVTVNSTTGTLALAAGVPVIALGRAVYALAGLTYHDGLDSFWAAAQPPQAGFYELFQRVLVEHCLLRGGFYDAAVADLVEAAARRIVAGEPIQARTFGTANPEPETLLLRAAE